jgi:phage tail sheath protein FI
MAQYLSPGVYVEEVPSAIQAIAGVGTNTAAFIGIVPDTVDLPRRINGEQHFPAASSTAKAYTLAHSPVATDAGSYEVWVGGQLDPGATLANAATVGTSAVTTTLANTQGRAVVVNYLYKEPFTLPVKTGVPKLCTNFSEFKKFFGDFSLNAAQSTLAHAVYGFFNNGGTRCYVVRIADATGLDQALTSLAGIDEVAIVAMPGTVDKALTGKIDTLCRITTQDRVAIFDSPGVVEDTTGFVDLTKLDPSNSANILPPYSDYAAYYFPWIQVFDPATKALQPDGDGLIYVPPSGHVAGVYARVDVRRGVFKAPANEVVMGALGLKYTISKAQQDGLNPQGVNCIRDLNGNIRVWGARTMGGNANGEWRYISVRRTMLFLRESIDEGLQWAVFEPNDQGLWAKIVRNVSAFLTTQWQLGMLFGSTAQEAVYVKCDAETNPPELREIGQVVTEIGVAIVKPAEFVIFRISQWQPSKGG